MPTLRAIATTLALSSLLAFSAIRAQAADTEADGWRTISRQLQAGEALEAEPALLALGQFSRLSRRCEFDDGWVELDGRFGRDAVFLTGAGYRRGPEEIAPTAATCATVERVVRAVVKRDLSQSDFVYVPGPETAVHCLYSNRMRFSHGATRAKCERAGALVVPVMSKWLGHDVDNPEVHKTEATHTIRPAPSLGELKLTVWQRRENDPDLTREQYETRLALIKRQIALEERYAPPNLWTR